MTQVIFCYYLGKYLRVERRGETSHEGGEAGTVQHVPSISGGQHMLGRGVASNELAHTSLPTEVIRVETLARQRAELCALEVWLDEPNAFHLVERAERLAHLV